jgi:hypothetical protein
MFDFSKKNKKIQEAKKLILKEYFNSGNQKKVITQAANKSAEDQNILLSKYQKLANS